MVNRYDTRNEPGPRTVRLAWMAAFFATVALMALLSAARSAQALALPDPIGAEAAAGSVPPSDEVGKEAEGESEAEECEAGEVSEDEAEEEGESEEGEECGGGPGQAPPQCLLTTAVSTVSASKGGKLRLAIRYTAATPITVEIDYWLRGGKGPLTMAREKEHFGARGVYHQTTKMTDSQMAKVKAAKSFTIRLRPLGAPGYCRPFQESHLTMMHASHGGLTWLDPEASRPLRYRR
jgi:hypothetical protein